MEPCLCNGKGFNYRAFFIDSIGDTLTKEIIKIVPMVRDGFSNLEFKWELITIIQQTRLVSKKSIPYFKMIAIKTE